MPLHPKDQAALDRFVQDLENLHGDALVAALLTGEAASAGYRPRRTPLTTLVILDEVTPAALRRTRKKVRAWRRRRIPTPLLMDPLYTQSSLDVFPLEFLEMSDHHRLLVGKQDPFESLAFHLPHLRLEVEEQARGKMLHLWEAYLESRSSRRTLRRLLLDTPPGFEVILRGMLRLRDAPRADAPDALLAGVEATFGVKLPVFRRLEAVRRGEQKLAGALLEETFEAYLGEVRLLSRIVDAL